MFQGSKSAFEVYLANEGAEDAGGPFREIIDDLCQELREEGVLPLLSLTGNSKAGLDETMCLTT